MKIYKTTDYEMFKSLLGNREVSELHVNNLMKSIREKNLLEKNPIIVTGDLEIVDGQHRLEAAKRLIKPIYYTISDDASIKEVRLLNAWQKTWSLLDFALSFAKLGDENYQILLDYVGEHRIPLAMAALLLSHEDDGFAVITRAKVIPTVLRAGDFAVINQKNAEEFAAKLHEYEPFTVDKLCVNKIFIMSLFTLYNNKELGISHDEMLDSLKLSGKLIERGQSIRDYWRQLEEIYNYRRVAKNRVRFF